MTERLNSSFIKVFILLAVMVGITACSNSTDTQLPILTPALELLPYLTQTSVPDTPIPISTSPIPNTPDPTATPYSHVIQKGETMLGIAIQYGIDLEDLQAANPGVDPNMLSVGTQIIIPLGDDVQDSMIEPTPIPITLGSLDCYPTADEGVWCFTLVENNYPYALESVSARIELYSSQKDLFTSGVAYPPLNIIGSNKNVPLMIFFASPVPSWFTAHAELLTAVAVSNESERYLDAKVEIHEVSLNPDGLSADVDGQITFSAGTRYPELVWLAVVAYDETGAVVGVRKWEVVFPQNIENPVSTDSLEINGNVKSSTMLSLPFDVGVYSLGPGIDRVDVLVEAQP